MQETNISVGNLEQCQKCSICTDVCPMMKVNPLYPGPKKAGPDGERYRMKSADFYEDALRYCLNCKRCEVACPSGVKVADLIQSAKLRYGRHDHVLRNTILGGTDLMGPVASTFAPVVNPVLKWGISGKLMDGVLAIDHRRQFPAYSGKRFVTWFKKEAAARQASYDRQVSYFHGCYVNYNYPKQGQDLVKILNAAGIGVQLLDKEKCCGVALIANGDSKTARAKAVVNMESMRKAKAEGRVVLTTSTTCTFTMRDEYPHLLGVDNADVRDSINLATRYICELVEKGEIRLAFRKDYVRKAAYHTPCHMDKLGWGYYSISLLKMIPGLDLTVLDQNCCGIAGTFGFKKENYEYSQAIGAKLFAGIKEASPEVVATDCETCKWQIEMSTGVPVLHPICILADALDVEKTIELNKK